MTSLSIDVAQRLLVVSRAYNVSEVSLQAYRGNVDNHWEELGH